MKSITGSLVGVLLLAAAAHVSAQEPAAAESRASQLAPADRAFTLTYANRPIVELRALVFARLPEERAAAAVRAIDDLVAQGITGPVSTLSRAEAVILQVADHGVIAILPDDVDALTGETLDDKVARASAQLAVALREAAELRAPGQLLRSAAESLGITVLLVLLLWLLWRLDRGAGARLLAIADKRLTRSLSSQVVRVTQLPTMLRYLMAAFLVVNAVVLTYLWLAFVLRQFPYTRPWGESLRSLLLIRIEAVGTAMIDSLPGLFTVLLIFLVAKLVSKALSLVFDAVAQGRLTLPGVYEDTAVASRRLIMAVVWLFALAAAYPHMPGSQTSSFQGISVFIGVIISLGSTGVVQNLMSGLMLTFARAVRPGDFASVGAVEGTVLQIGALATKLRTPCGEEVTIPNTVVVNQTMTNYSKTADGHIPMLTTSVTIGYDTPWRQVESLLLRAAQHMPGLRRTPAPYVWRMALEDYYVKYTLLVTPEDPTQRVELLDQLHSRILDAFNEYGVQIMSPHYMADPATPKVVPHGNWHAAPASRSAPQAADISLRS